MKDFEIQRVNRCLRWLANELVGEYLDKKLSVDLSSKVDTFYTYVGKAVDWENLTRENCLTLGFMLWSKDDSDEELWLIPHWLFPVIPEGMELTYIDNTKFEFCAATADQNIRFGVLSYGITLPSPDEFDLEKFLEDED